MCGEREAFARGRRALLWLGWSRREHMALETTQWAGGRIRCCSDSVD